MLKPSHNISNMSLKRERTEEGDATIPSKRIKTTAVNHVPVCSTTNAGAAGNSATTTPSAQPGATAASVAARKFAVPSRLSKQGRYLRSIPSPAEIEAADDARILRARLAVREYLSSDSSASRLYTKNQEFQVENDELIAANLKMRQMLGEAEEKLTKSEDVKSKDDKKIKRLVTELKTAKQSEVKDLFESTHLKKNVTALEKDHANLFSKLQNEEEKDENLTSLLKDMEEKNTSLSSILKDKDEEDLKLSSMMKAKEEELKARTSELEASQQSLAEEVKEHNEVQSSTENSLKEMTQHQDSWMNEAETWKQIALSLGYGQEKAGEAVKNDTSHSPLTNSDEGENDNLIRTTDADESENVQVTAGTDEPHLEARVQNPGNGGDETSTENSDAEEKEQLTSGPESDLPDLEDEDAGSAVESTSSSSRDGEEKQRNADGFAGRISYDGEDDEARAEHIGCLEYDYDDETSPTSPIEVEQPDEERFDDSGLGCSLLSTTNHAQHVLEECGYSFIGAVGENMEGVTMHEDRPQAVSGGSTARVRVSRPPVGPRGRRNDRRVMYGNGRWPRGGDAPRVDRHGGVLRAVANRGDRPRQPAPMGPRHRSGLRMNDRGRSGMGMQPAGRAVQSHTQINDDPYARERHEAAARREQAKLANGRAGGRGGGR